MPKPDVVPLTPTHKAGAIDPVSAILALTRADDRPPCDRRVEIFDGQQRYNIVLSFKRMTRVKAAAGGAHSEPAIVCRAIYEPVAGHRANEDTKAYAANHDVEIVMRHVPGTRMMIPSAIMVPTVWGTGSMVADRIEVVVSANRKFTMTE